MVKIYNVTGYSLIAAHLLVSGLAAPSRWGFLAGASAGLAYLIFIWFFGGLYLSDIMHMGIAHKTLDYRQWFIKSVVVFYNLLGIYINPTSWVNRHRHHHAFSDHDGDPNKLDEDGFWRTMYRTSHARDEYDFGFLTVRAMKTMRLVKATPSGAQKPEGILLDGIGF